MKHSEKVTFKNQEGQNLSGIIDFPGNHTAKAFVLFAHCFTCSKTLKAVDNISNALNSSGFAVLRFDFTGLGQSGGDFAETNFSMNLSDLQNAYEFLSERYEAPRILMGHSLGGAAVLHAAGNMEAVQAVVTVGAPSDPIHVKHLLSESEDEIREKGNAKVNIGGRPFTIKKQFLEDLEKNSSTDVIANLKRALLVIHSPQDNIVGIDNAAEIYQAAMHPKSFISLDGADHLMSNSEDSQYVGSVVAAWASRYLKTNQDIEDIDHTEVSIGKDGFYTQIRTGKFEMVADEPESQGGSGEGPSPYDYLMSALGACTAMTLRMYANYKEIPLDRVQVKLTHEKIHGEDCEKCVEGTKGKIDQIRRDIIIQGDLDEQQRKRLIEMADKCPVHKTLEGKPEILTREIEE